LQRMLPDEKKDGLRYPLGQASASESEKRCWENPSFLLNDQKIAFFIPE